MDARPNAYRRGYNKAWSTARSRHLRAHPLCAFCLKAGRVVQAQVVDHIQAHKGDPALFWNSANWQSLCKRCHDSRKQRNEHGRASAECGADGLPVDPMHPWNATT